MSESRSIDLKLTLTLNDYRNLSSHSVLKSDAFANIYFSLYANPVACRCINSLILSVILLTQTFSDNWNKIFHFVFKRLWLEMLSP